MSSLYYISIFSDLASQLQLCFSGCLARNLQGMVSTFSHSRILVCVWCGIYPLELRQAFLGGQRQMLRNAGSLPPSALLGLFPLIWVLCLVLENWNLCVLLPPSGWFCLSGRGCWVPKHWIVLKFTFLGSSQIQGCV